MKRTVKWILFLSSYIPLFLILIIQNIDIKKSFAFFKSIFKGDAIKFIKTSSFEDIYLWILIFICIFSIITLILLINQTDGFSKKRKITHIETNNGSILEYFVTYLLALSNSSFNLRDVIVFWIILLIIGYLYIKNNMFFINPTLHLLFKYNIYKVSYDLNLNGVVNSNNGFILSKLDEYEFNSYIGKNIEITSLADGFNSNIYIFNKSR